MNEPVYLHRAELEKMAAKNICEDDFSRDLETRISVSDSISTVVLANYGVVER